MKNSGIEWIGEIPEDWEVKTIKQLLFERNEKNFGLQTATILSLSAKEGITLYDGENHSGNKPREDLSDYKIVEPNDIVVNSMNILSGSVGLSKYKGCVSPVYYIYYPRVNDNIEYFYYVFQTKQFQLSLRGLGNGILIKESENGNLNTIRMRIPSYRLNMQYFPYCDKSEQDKIVKFLKAKLQQTDLLIENENSQIEKLKEYKQSVITEAVTKGLDSTVLMNDSGIHLIKKIPSHWKLVRIKNVATINNGKEVIVDGGEIPVYGSGGIFKYTNTPLFTGVSILLGRKGTIDNPLLVTGAFWTVDTMFYLSDIRDVQIKYLYYCCKSVIDYGYFKSGSVLPSMTQTELNNIKIPKPPHEEQKQIINFLDKKCGDIDKLIAIKQEKIEKLNEYKKSLIYEYVTGKKEVS